jgi:lactate dehydrogenase-like 2-hydroxyacid dehydrogenase
VIEVVGAAHDLSLLDPMSALEPQFAHADAVIDSGGSVGTREMLDRAPNVRLWQIMGSGFEHFDLEYWRARGVAVANCPGSASASALVERALMFSLMLAQKYGEARVNVQRGIAYRPAGSELAGKVPPCQRIPAEARRAAVSRSRSPHHRKKPSNPFLCRPASFARRRSRSS